MQQPPDRVTAEKTGFHRLLAAIRAKALALWPHRHDVSREHGGLTDHRRGYRQSRPRGPMHPRAHTRDWRREQAARRGHVVWGRKFVADATAPLTPGKPRPIVAELVTSKATAPNPLAQRARRRRRNKAARASRKLNRR